MSLGQGLLFEEDSLGVFLLVTVAMGGWAAWMTAGAIARTWRPFWQCLPALLAVAAAVRFIHFALFEGTLLSAHYFLVDAAFVLIVGAVGFRATRARQMVTQYRWLYERAGPLSWRPRSPAGGEP
ncbi:MULTISPECIES: DUF6867 family protein [Methylobacterium]|uniref:DUF6867 domain-containing protein n=1 Tax=Methylobacterium jeotgali TaxID=381630 RepID=A0ABQ4SWP7_9HYPH|nr:MULTISPECIES: hypothetical protein [Methylobacterium]GBU18845.1 hypothetical protein AwMethylo_30600 [Methylobacterium sp.]GJE06940.1 hypothetical protein AOPFMNJM_2263 [Methylobacterium jeotgali]